MWFSPASFLTEGIVDQAGFGENRAALDAAEDEAETLWTLIDRRIAKDGVTLIRPPAETVTRACLTRAEYGVDGAGDNNDPVHKSPAYAAFALAHVLAALAPVRQSA